MTANAELKRLVAHYPARTETILRVALEQLNGGLPAQASAFARRALAVQADNYFALFCLIQTLTDHGNVEEQLRLARKLTILEPSSEGTFYSSVNLCNRAALAKTLPQESYAYFLSVTRRSICCLGLKDYSAVATTSWFRDTANIDTLHKVYRLLGSTLNGASVFQEQPRDSVYLIEQDFTRFIGEMSQHFDYMMKLFELGHLPRRMIWVVSNPAQLSNPAALALWSPWVKLVTAAEVTAAKHIAFLRLDMDYLPFGKAFYLKTVVYCLVQRQWERKRRYGLLRGRGVPDHERRYSALLDELGWKETDQTVCFHVRETTHDRSRRAGSEQTFRNSEPETFRPALRKLIDAGFKIFRIGAAGTYSYGDLPGLFDYANSEAKAPELDVEIIRKCRFYLGSESGPLSLAIAFDKPCCTVNHAQFSFGAMPGRCVFSTKICLAPANHRPMSLSAMLRPPLCFVPNQEIYDKHGIKLLDNTSEEVLMTVEEFLHRLERDSFNDPATYGVEQRRAIQILKRHKVVSNGLLCRRFLQKYDYLLQ